MRDMKPVAGEAKMNRAEGHEPKSGHSRPAADHRGDDVGGEKKANMRGALDGNPTDGMYSSLVGHTHLSHAMKELHEQHPIEHHDHGPHHGTDHHIRHEPLHGMKPGKHR